MAFVLYIYIYTFYIQIVQPPPKTFSCPSFIAEKANVSPGEILLRKYLTLVNDIMFLRLLGSFLPSLHTGLVFIRDIYSGYSGGVFFVQIEKMKLK